MCVGFPLFLCMGKRQDPEMSARRSGIRCAAYIPAFFRRIILWPILELFVEKTGLKGKWFRCPCGMCADSPAWVCRNRMMQ